MKPTERFGERAAAYAAHRPGYAAESIDFVLDGLGDPVRLVVADIGAGTGISARAFAERGARVIAIEPNAAMRGSAEPDSRIEWRDGTGEATGLEDKSVDLAIAFQAFHWFATEEAREELRRIARRRIALAQYERDESDPISRELGDLYRSYALDDTEARRMRGIEFFAAFPQAQVSRGTFTWRRKLDLDGLLGAFASSSYLPRTGEPAERLKDDAVQMFARHARDGAIDIAMQTFVVRADLSTS